MHACHVVPHVKGLAKCDCVPLLRGVYEPVLGAVDAPGQLGGVERGTHGGRFAGLLVGEDAARPQAGSW